MAGILIYSEKSKLALELLTAARLLAGTNALPIVAVSINNDELTQALAASGADIRTVKNAHLDIADTAAMAAALQQIAEKMAVDTVLLSSNRRGKELAGRVAQLLTAGCLTDVKSLQTETGQIECVRNVLGGATVAVQRIKSARQVIALSPKAFPAADSAAGGQIHELQVDIKPSLKLVERRAKAGDSVDIEAAEILVIVGQGVENRQDLTAIKEIAGKMGAEIACSKPVATDKKWFGEERIVGLSGKICKPELAIILGVSGQVQFAVGIREARTIVSINNDEKAYMNQIADYVMLTDIQEVLPQLVKALG